MKARFNGIGEAYLALDAIQCAEYWRLEGQSAWLAAFETCRWVVRTDAGPVLTAAGVQAHDELARRFRRSHAA